MEALDDLEVLFHLISSYFNPFSIFEGHVCLCGIEAGPAGSRPGLELDLESLFSSEVLNYLEGNKMFFLRPNQPFGLQFAMRHARSKSGYLYSACEKARKGALDERGIGSVDPYREYLLSIAKPRLRIDLLPEADWLLTSAHAQEALKKGRALFFPAQVVFDVKADGNFGALGAKKERLLLSGAQHSAVLAAHPHRALRKGEARSSGRWDTGAQDEASGGDCGLPSR